MKNADKSAYPAPQHLHTFETVGLTKREIFAMTAMQGILANRESNIRKADTKTFWKVTNEILNRKKRK